MAKVGPNAVNLAIAEMIGQLLTFTTNPQCVFIEHTLREIHPTVSNHLLIEFLT